MITTTFIGLFCVLFAYIAGRTNKTIYITISFLILFAFLALRYNFGNDYKGYQDAFERFTRFDSWSITIENERMELGWIFLNKIFQQLGFYTLVATLSFLYCYTYKKLITNHVSINWHWLSIFILILTPNLMLIPASAMRQTLACLIFILSLKFVFERSFILYTISIIFASLFHASALILLPLYFLNYFSSSSKIINVSLISIYIFVTFIGDIFLSNLHIVSNLISKSYLDNYEIGAYSNGLNITSSLIRFVPYTAAVFLRLKYKNTTDLFFINLYIINQIVVQISFFMPMLNRFDMYLGFSAIVIFPLIFNFFWKKDIGKVFVVFYTIYIIKGFFNFFNHEVWEKAYGTYYTIFELLN